MRAQFVKLLLTDKVDFNKITKYDLDYLFSVAAFSLKFNSVIYDVTCDCGKKLSNKFDVAEKAVRTLDKVKLPYLKKIGDTEYNFHILSAQQHIDACEYGLQCEEFNQGYEDACCCFILGWSIDKIEQVRVYLQLFILQRSSSKYQTITACLTMI